ncbi:MAG: hypothetical protein F2924_05860, partial [Actinobacteria bacterium]|nr:hypothetical protein [Actinomycetota bacterium]
MANYTVPLRNFAFAYCSFKRNLAVVGPTGPSPSSTDRRARTCPEKESNLMASVVFEAASRIYPGTTAPAVDKLNLTV